MLRALLTFGFVALAPVALADEPGAKPAWFQQAVKSLNVTCDPAEAKPGQTVTLKIRLELADGYTVYPLAQTDPAAVGMVSKIDLPKPAGVVFVGKPADPAGAKLKAEPELGIAALKYYAGVVTWERKCVVNPAQKPGPLSVTLPSLKFAICDANSCFPPKGFPASAKLSVLGGPATPIEAEYAAEVAAALAKQ